MVNPNKRPRALADRLGLGRNFVDSQMEYRQENLTDLSANRQNKPQAKGNEKKRGEKKAFGTLRTQLKEAKETSLTGRPLFKKHSDS